ncbi:AAA family ATPase [Mycolicibacterium llatzerense]|uniref:AAA family ATPase n=1 Tax=Mycolicibacterium llatzerense TaxID=280871 RepID=UPI0013A6CBE0|nr:AAA family ATPase [Mycolicibacterium llatzerense]
MAAVAAAGVSDKVFEDYSCRAAYAWVLQYWQDHGTPPTTTVMDHEFPALKLPAKVDEPVDWLVEKLQERHVINRTQHVIIESSRTLDYDPEGTVVSLRDALDAILKDAGTSPGAALYTDLAAMLDNALPEAPRPDIMARTDGVMLFYRGEVNQLFGDPEHGKTWVGLAACAEVLAAGGRVLVADIDHNGASAIVSRLLLLGAPKETICDRDRFRHCEPSDVDAITRMVADCTSWSPDVVMVDSTGELLPMFGANSDSADDFTRVHAKVLQPLADLGAAVLLVDHLAKGRDSRALGPGGTMAKRRTVGGLSLRVERERAFSPSAGGSARLLINKDRHGGVRDHCAAARSCKAHDEQLAGTFVLDTNETGTTWCVTPPQADANGSGEEFRPTVYMDRVSRLIEERPGELTRNKIAEEATGKKTVLLLAVDVLEREGYINKSQERCPHYTSARPYRQSQDPRSDSHIPMEQRLGRHQESDGQDGQKVATDE